jgi:hypothetical protein
MLLRRTTGPKREEATGTLRTLHYIPCRILQLLLTVLQTFCMGLGLFGWRISPSQGNRTIKTEYMYTDIHASDGIETYVLSI